MIKFFVEKFPAVAVLSVLIFVVGFQSFSQLPPESSPEIKVPLIFVNTVYPGVSAKDMESLVTRQIEEEIDGLEGLKKITSTTQQSVSAIAAEFTGDTEVEVALRRVRERVDLAKPELPDDAEEPLVKELSFSDQPILILVLSNPTGLEYIESTVEMLEEEIKRIQGVLDVRISGKLEKELAVEVDPLQLKHYDISLDDVIQTVQMENRTIPGGSLKGKAKKYSLAVTGEVKDPGTFDNVIINAQGKKIRLQDVADVAFQYKDPETIARLNGKPAISISVTKRAGEDIVRIANDIKQLVEDLRPQFPRHTEVALSYDESETIDAMVKDLLNNIFTGLILVWGVTMLALGFVNSLFVSMAIPFSMLISFFVLRVTGITLNMVVLFSLILGLGMLVDNGIVIVENIFRHASLGKNRIQASIDGASEVAMPIATSTLTTILAFFPIIFMPGMMGEFMSYLPKTVIIVLSASLLVAVVINPSFCSRLLKIDPKQREKLQSGGAFYNRLLNHYEGVLSTALRFPVLTVFAAVSLVVSGAVALGILGKETLFFPKVDPPVATVHIEAPHGTPLNVTDSMVQALAEITREVPASLENLQVTTGLGVPEMFSSSSQETHLGNLRLGFVPFAERTTKAAKTVEKLRERVKGVPGLLIKVSEMEGGPPQGHPVSYEISGPDYGVLGDIADSILLILNKYHEFEVVDSDFESAKPEIMVEIDRQKAGQYGLNTTMVASTIRNAINGAEISQFRQGNDEFDVVVRYKKDYRDELKFLESLEIVKEEKRIPLSSIATLHSQATQGIIKRKNLKRTVEVYADFKLNAKNQNKIKSEILDLVQKVQLPPGYRIETGEGRKMQEEAEQFLQMAFGIAIFLIFIVLILQFNSLTQPLIILAAVALSLGGVLWGFAISGQQFVMIMSGVGVVSLAGVVVNNGIVLIDYINKLKAQGYNTYDAITEAGKTRLRPVLLTAITTILGLVPMAIGVSFDFTSFSLQIGTESSEWWKSMAWTIIYGLSFATILTLVVVPALVLIDDKFQNFIRRLMKKPEVT